MEQFSSKPWFPIGIVKETTQNKSISLFQHYNVHTEFGTLDMLNIENFDDIKVFNELIKNIENLDDFEIWGDFNYSENLSKPIVTKPFNSFQKNLQIVQQQQ